MATPVCDEEEVVQPVCDDAEEVAQPAGDDAEEVAQPAGDDADEVAQPVSDDAEEVAQPAGEPEPYDVDGDSCNSSTVIPPSDDPPGKTVSSIPRSRSTAKKMSSRVSVLPSVPQRKSRAKKTSTEPEPSARITVELLQLLSTMSDVSGAAAVCSALDMVSGSNDTVSPGGS